METPRNTSSLISRGLSLTHHHQNASPRSVCSCWSYALLSNSPLQTKTFFLAQPELQSGDLVRSSIVSQWVCKHFSHYRLNQTHDFDETWPQASYLMPNEGVLTTSKSALINLCHRRWTEVTVFTPVCLFVYLWTVLRKNSSTDFDETWWGD